MAHSSADEVVRLRDWLHRHAPWMPVLQAQALAHHVAGVPLGWRADAVARRINLTAADREHLRISTMALVDLTQPQRAALRELCGRDQARRGEQIR
jgi:hypothetical protein